ncbi:MAG: hypothetical protein ICV74_08625 [Thermoleophilia bacterium]|nr:hypothetical protein [Thermoleophilia bacterium]
MPLRDQPRVGVPAPPDSPANVPDAPEPSPGPSEPLEPGFPQPPREDDGEDESG